MAGETGGTEDNHQTHQEDTNDTRKDCLDFELKN